MLFRSIGGGAGRLRGGRHVRCPDPTPMSNLHVTLLDKLGVPVERFGTSTGDLDAAWPREVVAVV